MSKLSQLCKTARSGLSFSGILFCGFILFFPCHLCRAAGAPAGRAGRAGLTAAQSAIVPEAASKESVCPSRYKIPSNTDQLAVVRYKSRSKGTLSFYQRDKNGRWIKSFSCTAWLGKRGIGKKKEGDQKTPAGFYYLEQPFGILKNPGMDKHWPYLKVSSRHYWCTSFKGKYKTHYNRLITSKRRIQGEHLIDYKGVYDYGMFITYNKAGKGGKGSAIFLHCSRNRPTAGCVAINKKYLKKLMRKLIPERHPGIVIYDANTRSMM